MAERELKFKATVTGDAEREANSKKSWARGGLWGAFPTAFPSGAARQTFHFWNYNYDSL